MEEKLKWAKSWQLLEIQAGLAELGISSELQDEKNLVFRHLIYDYRIEFSWKFDRGLYKRMPYFTLYRDGVSYVGYGGWEYMIHLFAPKNR